MKKIKNFYLFLAILFFVLFSTNSISRFYPDTFYFPDGNGQSTYLKNINELDKKYLVLIQSDFIKHANEVISNGMLWPSRSKISYFDNWMLGLLGEFDVVATYLGMQKSDTHALRYFESTQYERALSRKTGYCSQLALALADILNRRYNIETHMIGLDGHVVVEAIIDNRKFILDPSVNISFDYSLDDVSKHVVEIREKYQLKNEKFLADFYFTPNFYQKKIGSYSYHDKQFAFNALRFYEHLTDFLSPLIACLLTIFFTRKYLRS